MALSIQTTAAGQTSSALDPQNGQIGPSVPKKYSGTTTPIEDCVLFTSPVTPRLIISIEGEEKTGKDHFSFTAPAPVYLQTCDPAGTDGVRQKFPGKIYGPKEAYSLSIQPNECTPQQMKKVADPVLDRWVANYRWALTKMRTIVWDTADELWELARLAKFGELTPKMSQGERNNQYGELNTFYEGLIKEAFAYPINFIMIHRLKNEYKANASTGNRVRAGYKDLYYLTQVNLRSLKEGRPGGGANFGVQILDCRRNPDIEGTVMANNFIQLAMMVLPEVDPDTWR